MDDLKQAYAVLGLREDASKEEVEERYYLLLRRARVNRARGGSDEAGDTIDLETVNRAYRLIVEHEERKAIERLNSQLYGENRKWARWKERLDYFYQYYRFHALGAVVAIVLLVVGVNSYLERKAEQEALAKLPPADVSVSFFGEYFTTGGENRDTKPLEEALLALFPEWKRVTVGLTYVPKEPRNEYDVAMLQKSILDLISEKRDVYILDRNNFEKLVRQGALLPLDDAAEGPLKPLLSPNAAVRGKSEEDTKERIYGIDIGGSPLIGKLPVKDKEMIAGIRSDSQNTQNALRFIEKFLQEKP